jgi:HNH endonuclease
MANADLTVARVRELLSYDPLTGSLAWRESRGSVAAGKVCGTADKHGYLVVRVDGRLYKAHRLAWMHLHGNWPAGVIDHINHCPADNRAENLRDVTQAVNGGNLLGPKKGNASGFLGVHYCRRSNRFIAEIKLNRKKRHIGAFRTAEEASSAYLTAKREMHPGCII